MTRLLEPQRTLAEAFHHQWAPIDEEHLELGCKGAPRRARGARDAGGGRGALGRDWVNYTGMGAAAPNLVQLQNVWICAGNSGSGHRTDNRFRAWKVDDHTKKLDKHGLVSKPPPATMMIQSMAPAPSPPPQLSSSAEGGGAESGPSRRALSCLAARQVQHRSPPPAREAEAAREAEPEVAAAEAEVAGGQWQGMQRWRRLRRRQWKRTLRSSEVVASLMDSCGHHCKHRASDAEQSSPQRIGAHRRVRVPVPALRRPFHARENEPSRSRGFARTLLRNVCTSRIRIQSICLPRRTI